MKIVKAEEDCLIFDNGLVIKTYHRQDCCEHVYADFAQIEPLAMDFNFPVVPEIETVPGQGIKIQGFFVPCYNIQNGYYSSNLSLQIGEFSPIDISGSTHYNYKE